MFNDVYCNKTVLVTGHAGFKGCWLSLWLKQMGAKVVGYSLIPDTTPCLYEELNLKEIIDDSLIADIRDEENLNAFFAKHNPDIVFHLAAQPLVRLSYSEPILTYDTNVLGTLKVLEAARRTSSVKAFVNVTTDKCYENKEREEGYREDEPMGGYDMYSSSKGCSEILTASYRRSFLKDNSMLLASARAGNVIGGGDWSLDRLIPDCVEAFRAGKAVDIRNPIAVRPWQFVLEPLAGYLLLGQKLLEGNSQFAQGYNFGPLMGKGVRVAEVAQLVAKVWGNGVVKVGEQSSLHEAGLLQLDITKAETQLGFEPVYDVQEAVTVTTNWYKEYYLHPQKDKTSWARDYTVRQLNEFVTAAQKKLVTWSIK